MQKEKYKAAKEQKELKIVYAIMLDIMKNIVESESPELAAGHLQELCQFLNNDEGAIEMALLSFVLPAALKNNVNLDILSVLIEKIGVQKYAATLDLGCKYGNDHLVDHMIHIGAPCTYRSALYSITAGSQDCLLKVLDNMLDNNFESKKASLIGHATDKGYAECIDILHNY